jgi:hypothetical protein
MFIEGIVLSDKLHSKEKHSLYPTINPYSINRLSRLIKNKQQAQ